MASAVATRLVPCAVAVTTPATSIISISLAPSEVAASPQTTLEQLSNCDKGGFDEHVRIQIHNCIRGIGTKARLDVVIDNSPVFSLHAHDMVTNLAAFRAACIEG